MPTMKKYSPLMFTSSWRVNTGWPGRPLTSMVSACEPTGSSTSETKRWLTSMDALLPLILMAVRAVEDAIPLPGQGRKKLDLVLDVIQQAYEASDELSRSFTFERLVSVVVPMIGKIVDLNNDGRKDPHNIHDAALAAGVYLCRGNRNLTIPGDWWNAILSYNNVRPYAQDVFNTANRYGQASRT